ncbi:MAG TPA: toll/interleukin-1 receptor domain-containing protein, partial [Polyangiaceae bacterium]|nr:toll/interleukin-1 receptor domain-containing protein [Polyangiaceae bacterium]
MAIFISYRREDSQAITGRIDDHLRLVFGDEDVYRDIDSIPLGSDFVQHVREALAKCDICIVIVGRAWLSDRLQQEGDFVRLELETVLARSIPVIPVLVERAELPRPDQIPESLLPLLRRQAATIDSGNDFKMHIGRLVDAIRAIRARGPSDAAHVIPRAPSSRRGLKWVYVVAAACALGAGTAVLAKVVQQDGEPSKDAGAPDSPSGSSSSPVPPPTQPQTQTAPPPPPPPPPPMT